MTPDVEITLRYGESPEWHVKANHDFITLPSDIHRDQLPDVCDSMRRWLTTFKSECARSFSYQVPSVSKLGIAATKALNRGLHELMKFVSRKGVYELARFMTKATRGIDVPVVHVVSDLDTFFPIEALPLFYNEPSSMTDLDGVASQFLGFRAVVHRISSRSRVEGCRVLNSAEKLPLKLFQYAGLNGVSAETEFFAKNASAISCDGPWPHDGVDEATVTSTVVSHLHDPRLGFSRNLDVSDEIQHFSCHCRTTGRPHEHELRLQSPGGGATRVFLSSLNSELVQLGDDPVASKPIVFLNACGAIACMPNNSDSFLKFFLRQNRNRGVIGTQANIPDETAAWFPQYFYKHLLEGNHLGLAMLYARQSLLRNHVNPLGLLYVAFAQPNICVSTKRGIEILDPENQDDRQ